MIDSALMSEVLSGEFAPPELLRLEPGQVIQHRKRGTTYQVLGCDQWSSLELQDNQIVRCRLGETGLLLEVLQQCSLPLLNGLNPVIFYRSFVSSPGDPWLFMRPTQEFTTDRFILIG